MCDKQRLRSACAYVQSDLSLYESLEYSMTVLTEQHLEFLSLKRGCTGSYEFTLVKMPHCWKSHVAAQFPKSYGLVIILEDHEYYVCQVLAYLIHRL